MYALPDCSVLVRYYFMVSITQINWNINQNVNIFTLFKLALITINKPLFNQIKPYFSQCVLLILNPTDRFFSLFLSQSPPLLIIVRYFW